MKLKRTKQCAKCPWRKDSDAYQIDAYNLYKHKQLTNTITQSYKSEPLHVMACHESPDGDESYCLGWLMNQIGIGNNIGLRMRMLNCTNLSEVSLVGMQHTSFNETLPVRS